MIQVSIVAFLTGGAFLGLAYWDLPYHLIAIVVLMRRIVENKLSTKVSAKDQIAGEENKLVEKKKWKWER